MEPASTDLPITGIDVLIEPDGGVVPDDPGLATAIRLFEADYARLQFEHPRYYAVLAILTKYWSQRIPTLAVGLTRAGIHQLWINPAFYPQVDEQQHRVAMLMHEVHHIVLGHCVVREWPAHVHKKSAAFTVACELAANTHVPLPLPTSPIRPIVPGRYGLPERLTTMEYFMRIVREPSLKGRVQSAARRIRRDAADRLPEVASGPAETEPAKDTDLGVLRAAAEVGDDERDVVTTLARDRLAEQPPVEEPDLPEVESVEGHAVPDKDWQAAHGIRIDGEDIRDSRVFGRILNVLVEDLTRGYSFGGTFRSRTFKRPNRRQVEAFGCPGIRRSGGGPARELDLCLLVDATSSMWPYIANVANNLFGMVNRLSRWRAIDWRVGLTWYRDCGFDVDYFRQYPFTRDVGRVKEHLENLWADGGGDEPESAAWALWHAARRASVTFDHPTVRPVDPWRPTAKRVVFLVTDASCHLKDRDLTVQDAVRAALAAKVRVYILGPWTWKPYQQLVQMTRGKLFRVERLVAPTEA